MSTTTICPTSQHIELPCLQQVPWYQPFSWLKAGARDFRQHWPESLAYGVLFAVLGYGLVQFGWTRPHVAMALTSGFLLIAPFLALGFYDLSLRGERTAAGGIKLKPFAEARENLASIGLLGLLLAFILSAWERLSAILIGLYLGSGQVPEAGFGWLFSSANLELVVVYAAFGGVLAALVFALSVVSLPMLMDRRVDVVTAVVTSLWAVRANPAAMLVWAASIVLLTAVGIATAFVGLAMIFPILGHATWHAYRSLVLADSET